MHVLTNKNVKKYYLTICCSFTITYVIRFCSTYILLVIDAGSIRFRSLSSSTLSGIQGLLFMVLLTGNRIDLVFVYSYKSRISGPGES